ncbi:VWD domain-containing protein [Catenulispora pinisilvae]|uniref:VWD domain-containing protein n=1 Tax=Catenulispora pinisilvae TaxID=2705253 RepID=UPI00189277AE|nr:VWD domain-containing protein [Catenulispora pinisilvae]
MSARGLRVPRLATGLAFAGQLLCLAAVTVFLLGLTAGGQQRAAAATRSAWLGLTVSAPRTVKVGDPLALHLTVTNQTGRPCGLAPSSQGTVGLAVRRDGVPLYPGFAVVEPIVDIRSALAAGAQSVAPGGRISLSLSSTSESGASALSALSLAPDGTTVKARWLLDKPGSYAIAVTYAMPGGPGECPGSSGTATVTITVAKHCAKGFLTPLLPTLPWLFGGGAVLALPAALSLLGRLGTRRLVLSRRLVLARATAVAVCTALIGLSTPVVASADIVIADGADTDLKADYNQCLATFTTDDPLDIIPGLLHLIHVEIHREYGDISSSQRNFFDPTRLEVYWNPHAPLAFIGGVPEDMCATLYHELIHISDMSAATTDDAPCSDKYIVMREEVRASRGENLYRANRQLMTRPTYGSKPLPPGTDPDYAAVAKDCDATQPPPPPPPVRNTGGCNIPDRERPQAQLRASRRDQESPEPDFSGASCSTGDPHFTTFDGRQYDFQTVGEFVLAKADGIEVQARQAPLFDSRLASVNSAVGLRVGSDRLSFAMQDQDQDGIRIQLNGVDIVPSTDPLTLPGGGTLVVADDGQFETRWPDGTEARIGTMSSWGLSLVVVPSTTLRGKTQGLLGNYDGDPSNDLVTGAGQVLADPPDPKLLFGPFADSWRVTDTTSLLPYPPGTDTATFTDKTFPDKPVTLADLDPARVAEARALCRALGVTDSPQLEACVLDVALSGQPAFATAAEDVNQHVTGQQPPPGGVVEPGGTLRDGSRAAGSLAEPGQTDVYHLDLGPATVFRLADLTKGDGNSGTFTLTFKLDPDQSLDAPGFTYTSNYQWRVDRGGTYTLTVTRTDGDTGPYGFILLTAKEKRIPMTVGQAVSGNLEARGRVDIHTFTAPATGKLHLNNGTGCDLSAGLVDDSPAPNVLVPYGVCSDIDMETVEAGKKYDLIIWSDDQNTGQYSFTPVIIS